jgi:hypothetical protein
MISFFNVGFDFPTLSPPFLARDWTVAQSESYAEGSSFLNMPCLRAEKKNLKKKGEEKRGGKRHVSKGLVIHSFEKIITYPLILPWLACL